MYVMISLNENTLQCFQLSGWTQAPTPRYVTPLDCIVLSSATAGHCGAQVIADLPQVIADLVSMLASSGIDGGVVCSSVGVFRKGFQCYWSRAFGSRLHRYPT